MATTTHITIKFIQVLVTQLF